MYGVKAVVHVANELTIGALAAAADVHVETIRFYQRKGLVSQPRRPHGGIRRYGLADLARVRFIKAAQRLGFSLGEVAELLQLDDGTQCRMAREMGERTLADVRAKLADLQRIEATLAEMVDRCRAARGAVKCPLIESLQGS